MAPFRSSLMHSSLPLIASLIASASALPTTVPRTSDHFPPENSTASSISWSVCPPDLSLPETLQCATYSVPIDWDEPYGEHLDLGLVKLPAAPSNSTPRVGFLFANPGGPGGWASQFVAQIAMGQLRSEKLLEAFDMIGLDPRGVGLSKQVECDMEVFAERVSLFPQSEDEFEKLVDKNKRLGASCRERTGPLLEHLDSISTAKDHEAVRVALGNEPMNYLGMSYGTLLGAQYAALFPDNIRTLALDGITQHSQSEAANVLINSASYALELTRFFDWAGKNESSALKGQDVEALWTSLLTNATSTPIPAPSCNGTDCRTDVNAEEIVFNSEGFLGWAGPETDLGPSWQTFSSALYNASRGDASALSTPFSDQIFVTLAIGCLDWTRSTSASLPAMLAKQTMAAEYSPLNRGASFMWQVQHWCLGWPVDVKNPPKKLDVKTNATVLMTQSTADPSTGLPWALGMLEEIENKVLVLRQGDGHTSLQLDGKTTEVIIEYLVTRQAPEEGLVLDS